MKASHSAIARTLLLSSALFAAACVPAPDSTPSPEETAAPVQQAPAPTPSPTPVAASQPKYESWMDAPRTPGDWSYYAEMVGNSRYGVASYNSPDGTQLFTIMCSGSGNIVLQRWVDSVGQLPLTIRTETTERTIMAPRDPEGRKMVAAVVRPTDPLLDAMALTKGRFAVETSGKPTLYLPAWAEVTRVIEDCR